jgi:hypothetical protein
LTLPPTVAGGTANDVTWLRRWLDFDGWCASDDVIVALAICVGLSFIATSLNSLSNNEA